MVLETIAAGAVAVLGPFLKEGGNAFAKKVGESLAETAKSLYGTIKKKFSSDPDAEHALALIEAKPDSEGRLMTLQELLVEHMGQNSEFADTVAQLVEQARNTDTRNIIAFGERSMAAAKVKDSVFVTGDHNTVKK